MFFFHLPRRSIAIFRELKFLDSPGVTGSQPSTAASIVATLMVAGSAGSTTTMPFATGRNFS